MKYVHDLSNNKDVMDIHHSITKLYHDIKNNPIHRDTDSTITIRSNQWDNIDPDIVNFKNSFNMRGFILFLEYNSLDWFSMPPHAHTEADCSIFFPINYSRSVKTCFFEPEEENVKTRVIPGGGFILKECFNTNPTECFSLSTPHYFRVDKFHKACLINEENNTLKRVVCSWESKDNYKEMMKRFGIDS